MNNINLYDFIKQKSQEKGRPLKIVCDWDECLQSPKSFILWELSPKNLTYPEYFKNFWNKASLIYYPSGFGTKEHVKSQNYSYIDPHDSNEKINRMNQLDDATRRQNKNYTSPDFYDKMPFTLIKENLALGLKENLISELVIMTSYKKGKHPLQAEMLKKEKISKRLLVSFLIANFIQ